MSDHAPPTRLVNWSLILWGLALAAIPFVRIRELPPWVWLGWGVAAANIGIGIWGLWRGRWLGPMFAALYLLAICLVAAGPLTGVDIYPAAGVLCLTVLSVGAAILHRLGRRAGEP